MSQPDTPPSPVLNWPVTRPWPWLIAGLMLTGAALLLTRQTEGAWVPLRVAMILAGLIAVGGAISLRLQSATWDFPERLRSAGMVALGALASLLGCFGMAPEWDSARLALGVLANVALVGAGILLLPQTARRIVVSLLVLFHFGGILMAVTSIPPPNSNAPWLTVQLWTRVYRPYLHFMYLNNAYHFYSPEPGPPILAWFYLTYSDGSSRWVKVPNREDFHTKLEFQRRLALCESINHQQPGPPVNFDQIWYRRLAGDGMENLRPEVRFRPPHEVSQLLATAHPDFLVIPPYPAHLMPAHLQYRPPTPYSRTMMSTYARHVARHYPSASDPAATVTGVKAYRMVQRIIMPGEMVAGLDPYDKTTYLPFFQGEFDADGKLMDPNDPLLYWAIPIMQVPKPKDVELFRVGVPQTLEMETRDYLEQHATKSKTRRPQQ